jgi:hypothetical protein
MDIVQSKNGVPIRLTEERWFHITEEHSEMAGYYFEVLETITEPEAIYEGKAEELLAVNYPDLTVGASCFTEYELDSPQA